MKRLICFCILSSLQLYADWETSLVRVSTTMMKQDSNVQDIQNFQGGVIEFKLWQLPILGKSVIFLFPVSFTYLEDPSSNGGAFFSNAITWCQEAYFLPFLKGRKFSPYLRSEFGPAIFSRTKMGYFDQGGNFGFQSSFGIGSYFTEKASLSVGVFHYCSFGLYSKNKGMTIPVVSGGASY